MGTSFAVQLCKPTLTMKLLVASAFLLAVVALANGKCGDTQVEKCIDAFEIKTAVESYECGVTCALCPECKSDVLTDSECGQCQYCDGGVAQCVIDCMAGKETCLSLEVCYFPTTVMELCSQNSEFTMSIFRYLKTENFNR